MSEKPAVDDIHCAGCLVKERRIAQLEAENEALREGWVLTLMDTGPQSLSHEDAKSYIDVLLKTKGE